MQTNLNRRDFLRTAALAGASAAITTTPVLAASASASQSSPTADAAIVINLIGGPSQLDTWDPKPEAPSEVRGPFRPIATRVPGLQFSELFPRMASIADQFAVIRSVYHDNAPIHELGLQWLNTGQLFRDGPDAPNIGAVLGQQRPTKQFSPFDWVVMPFQEVDCGIRTGVGLDQGELYSFSPNFITWDEGVPEFMEVMEQAVQLVATGTRLITINMYRTVFDQPTWDCHAAGGSLRCDLNDYRTTVAPVFDHGYTYLLERLRQIGLLSRTLVVAAGEFGRTPKLNSNGGRDHWTGCWTALMAGGGVRGGQVYGASDATGSEPSDRPVHIRDLPATVLNALGVPNSFGTVVRDLF